MDRRVVSLNRRIDAFILCWDNIIVDYWWRKKYNVPFGSRQHREMNLLDMLIEFREDKIINNSLNSSYNKQDDISIDDSSNKVVPLSQEEIDSDYDDLDLNDFNK